MLSRMVLARFQNANRSPLFVLIRLVPLGLARDLLDPSRNDRGSLSVIQTEDFHRGARLFIHKLIIRGSPGSFQRETYARTRWHELRERCCFFIVDLSAGRIKRREWWYGAGIAKQAEKPTKKKILPRSSSRLLICPL